MSTATRSWEQLLRNVIGDVSIGRLVQAMLDVAVPPMNLAWDGGPTLNALRDAALDSLAEYLKQQTPEQICLLRGDLPWHLQDGELGPAVLECGTRDRYFALPDSIYEASPADSRVLQRVPRLRDLFDDDGLLRVDGLKAESQALFVDDWAVHYHQLLRRHFSSNVNDALLGVLLEAARRSDNELRLAIDHRRICSSQEFHEFGERDYWYGPPLTDAWLDDPYAVGRTVHEDPAGDDAPSGFRAFYAYWRMGSSTEKIVQIEELPTLSSQIEGRHLCRYLHAIRDIERKVFIHCDGAVRMYEDATFAARGGEAMPTATNADRYRKVFRIDGSIETQEWSHIVAKWFRHNQLAFEYLGGLGADPVY